MHNIKGSGATVGADMVTALELPEMLQEIIDEGMYLPKRQDCSKRGCQTKVLPVRTKS